MIHIDRRRSKLSTVRRGQRVGKSGMNMMMSEERVGEKNHFDDDVYIYVWTSKLDGRMMFDPGV